MIRRHNFLVLGITIAFLLIFSAKPLLAQGGTITPGNPTAVNIDTSGENEQWTFTATAGQLASVQLSSSTFSGCWALDLVIIGPDGSTLGDIGPCDANSVFLNPVTLPSTGTYTVAVNPRSSGTGTGTITLYVFSEQTGTVNSASPVNVTINIPGQDALLSFSGSAGQLASVQLTNSTFPGCWSMDLTIVAPDGSTLGDVGPCNGNAVYFGSVTLPTTGTYNVVVAPRSGGTGSATVELYQFSEQTGAITSGTPTSTTINTPGQSAQWTFSGTAGQLASVQLSNSTFPGCWSMDLEILGPDGSTLGDTGPCNADNATLGPFTLSTTGTYTVVVAPRSGGTGSATVELYVFSEQSGTIAAGTPTNVNISTPGQNIQLAFTAYAGQSATVQLTDSTFPGCWSMDLEILNSSGSSLGDTGPCGPGSATFGPITLANAGAYSVLVAPRGGGTGSAIVTLTLTGGPTTPSVVLTTSGTPSTNGQAVTFTAATSSDIAGQTLTFYDGTNTLGTATISTTAPYATTYSTSALASGTHMITAVFAGNANSFAATSNPVGQEILAATATPSLSPSAGSYTGAQIVTISDSSSGATIYFTTNGATPTTSSNVYTGPITVNSTETLQAIAVAAESTQSAVASAAYTISPSTGSLSVFVSPPGAQSTTVAGAITETFDGLSTGIHTTAYVSNEGIGTYTGSSTNPFAIMAHDQFGGATDSNSSSPTNYFAIGAESGSSSPVTLALAQPAAYFGFWFSAGDAYNRVALYSGSTLFGTFSTADLVTFLNDGQGTITASNGTQYQASAYFGNPDITSGNNDGGEPFAYVSFVITGATIDSIVFYNTTTTTGFESDNHSVIFTGNAVTVPSTYVPVENLPLSSQVVEPSLSPVGGTYATEQTVTILTPTSGASIRYTTDGTTPSTTVGTLYIAPITVPTTETIKAIAYEAGLTSSSLASTAYSIVPVSVAVSPSAASVDQGGTEQFTAAVTGNSNTAVTWTTSPSGIGTITSSGLYTGPSSVTTQQTVTITATAQVDSTKSASGAVTLYPPCTSSGYGYVRTIVTDHNKVSNTDQSNFPLLFSITDPALASTANGGHVTNSNGYDVIFTTDAAGQSQLNYEIEKYNPVTGQLIAWVSVPALSHSTDTVLYLFYGNPSITSSQQNPAGVWGASYMAVYHLADLGAGTAADSTANGNNASLTSVAPIAGEIGGSGGFNGTSSYMAVPTTVFAPASGPAPTEFSIGVWFRTGSAGGILGETGGGEGEHGAGNPGSAVDGLPILFVDMDGKLRATFFSQESPLPIISASSYNDNQWHYALLSYANDSEMLYVDGTAVGSQAGPQVGFSSANAFSAGSAQTYLSAGGNGWWLYLNGAIDEFEVSTVAPTSDWVRTQYNNQSSPGTFYVVSSENSEAVVPASVVLYASQSEQFSSTAIGSCGTAVTWSLPTGSPGTLTVGGLYTAPTSISSRQTVAITAANQVNPTNTATATVTLLPSPSGPALSLAASGPPPYIVGTSQQFGVTLSNRDGTPLAGVSIQFAVTGANNSSGSETTDANGNASYTYVGTNAGNDSIQASANIGSLSLTSNIVAAPWISPAQQISTSPVTGEFFLSDGSGGFDTPPDATPVFTQTFPVINFNPPTGTIPGNTSSVDINTRPFTNVTTDVNGNYTGTIVAEGNGYQAGVGPMFTFQLALFGTFKVAAAGNVVFNFYDDDGFVFGVGNGATRSSGTTLDMPIATAFAQYPAVGAYDVSTGPVGNQVVVNFPAPGTYPYEVDYSECCGGQLVLTMTSGASSPTGIPPTSSLTLSPNSIAPLAPGGQQTFTVLANDASGAPVPNLNLSLVITGEDDLQLTGVTDSTGHATIVYHDVNPGTAFVQAVAFVSGQLAYSNTVSVPWTLPQTTSGGSGGLSISISAQSTITLPSTLQLTGTVSDSNLPQGGTIAVTWSQVSGPGTLAFSSPQLSATTASFSQPGDYVVELSASDSDASGSVQSSVTVIPQPPVSQGRIGSPLYGSSVSGIAPITLASGVALQSGTLVYYPVNNPNDITVLNANTTGSGQIGALDTTTLANGSYIIQLYSTTTSESSEYDSVLVTATGTYKPGRVTSTITDLVVPATGLAINLQRTYDTLNAGTSSDFGYGWSLGINVNLAVDPKGDVTFTLGGQRRTFYLAPQFIDLFGVFGVNFTPEPGFHGTLSDSASGCADDLDFVLPDGSLWVCLGGGLYNPPGYVYTDPTGTAYSISASGNLQSIVDKNGNGLTITANGITSTTGLSVPFVRDSSGRITQITDPHGNTYSYTYDSNGNLATVTYPNTAQPSTYTYDSSHRYLSGTDFRSNPLPTTAYYGPTDTDTNGLPLNGRLHSVTDSLNETTSYAYNLVTNTTSVNYPQDAGGYVGTATMVYDSLGDLLTSTDPLSHTTTNVYDSDLNLVSTADPMGHTTTFAYDKNGNKTSTTYPATATSTNTTSTTAYNQFSEPTSTIDELGNVRTFNYDANFNPLSVTDGLGTLSSFIFNADGTLQSGAIGYDISSQPAKASQFTYDANGNLASRTDALGRTTSYTYDSLGHKLTMTEPLLPGTTTSEATTTHQYDPFGNLTQTSAPLGRVTSSIFDANNNKVSDTDARGNATTYVYDTLNRLIETNYPASPASNSTKTYDFRGNVISETDQAGHITLHQYDLAGRQTSVIEAYGTTNATATAYGYDNAGRKVNETDALGHTTNDTYDAAGNLTAISGPKGNFSYGYDDARNQIAMTNVNTTQYAFDARKRLVTTTYPDETTKVNAYDGPGNLISATDQAGNVNQYTYDAANQLTSTVQTNSPNTSANTTIVGYDANGNPIVLEDVNIHVTASTFDLVGELTQKILPDGSLTEARSYDANGNLASLTHFNSVTTTYTYDTLNRLLSRSTPGETSVSFTYTPMGKYATNTDASGTTTYTYDSMDRLIAKATPQGTLTYTYDAAAHVASIASSNSNGATMSYTYDTLNRLSTVVDNRLSSGHNTTAYTYDPASNVATVTDPNGVESQFTYDTLNRVTDVSSQVSGYTYQRGPTGNLTAVVESSGRAVQWSYDGIYRLTNETISLDPINRNGSEGYTLDPVGNRLSENSTLEGVDSGAFAYDADDRLSTETYDQNGNVLTTGGKSFAYDSQNHLVSMNGSAVTLVYDTFGNRVSKTVSGVTTKYLVDDDVNPTGYPQVFDELTGGAVTRTYTYGLQRISEYQVVKNVWTPSFYGYDGGGNVRQLTNSVGAVTDTYEYGAYGNLFATGQTTPNDYLYRGEQYDPDLGLYYLRARYYNPGTGRFTSRDPEEGKPVDPRTLHKYLYAGGDPVNRIDPSGRDEEEAGEADAVSALWAESKPIRQEAAFNGCMDAVLELLSFTYGFNVGSGDTLRDAYDIAKGICGIWAAATP